MCHTLRGRAQLVALCALAAGACGPKRWDRTSDRVCDAKDPPTICLDAVPDQPLELEIAGASIVPGECMQATEASGGRVAATLVDGRGSSRDMRLAVREGQITRVVKTGEDKAKVETRTRCDRLPHDGG